MRKPWMKELQSMRFTRDGTMTTETARWQREANAKAALCVWLSRQIEKNPTLGEQWEDTMRRCGFTTYGQTMEANQ